MNWPVFFTRKALKGRNIELRRGQVFPFQDRAMICDMAPAFGVPAGTPFGALPYVEALNVAVPERADEIVQRGLTIEEARRLVRGELTHGE